MNTIGPVTKRLIDLSIDEGTIFYVPQKYSDYTLDTSGGGVGSLGEVKKFDSPNGLPSIAIKKFYNPFNTNERAQLILREILLLRSMRHPNIARLLDTYTVEESSDNVNSIYHITEYCGVPLRLRIDDARTNHYSMEHAKKWTRELLRAVQYLHSYGEIHRDLKPSSMCIDVNNKLTLLDFGKARVINRMQNMTTERGQNPYMPIEELVEWKGSQAEQIGYSEEDKTQISSSEKITQPYMPMEELVEWQTAYDEKVDIWSMATIVCEIITGVALFSGERVSNSLKLQIEICGSISDSVLNKVKSEFDRKALYAYSRKFERRDFIQMLCQQCQGGRLIQQTDILEHEQPLRDFLDNTLQFDPNARLSTERALSHPFLQTPRSWERHLSASKEQTLLALRQLIEREIE